MPTPTNPWGWTPPQPIRAIGEAIDPSDARLHTSEGANGFYRELTGNYSPGTNSFGIDNAQCQLVVQVPWEYEPPAVFHFLGYQYVVGTQLRRQPPLCHPRYEYLRCRHILQSRGVKHLGLPSRAADTVGLAYPRPNFAEYSLAEMTLNFETIPFAVKTDAEITYEYERWTWPRTEPGYESLYVEGGSGSTGGNYLIDSGTSDTIMIGGAPVNVSGSPAFAGGRNIPYALPKFMITWFDVPTEFISKVATPYYYNNIYAGLQTVNDAAFFGFPAHTLLMDSPQIEVRANPIPPTVSTTPTFLANITFVFYYLEPTPLGTGVSTTKGHNMVLYKGNFKWYPFSLDGTGADAKLLFKKYDYRKLFQKPV